MPTEQQLAFSQQLASLAAKELSDAQKDTLIQVIGGLFDDLELGHSCSNLSREQINLLLKSNLAQEYLTNPPYLKALPISILSISNKSLVYITKYLQYELDILHKIKSLCSPPSCDDMAGNNSGIAQLVQLSHKFAMPNQEQLLALERTLGQKFNIITGGPGTGKTTIVVLLLWLLYHSYGADLRINVCAPTGKASKRIKDSIQNSINNYKLASLDFNQVKSLLKNKRNFTTIHKLLGYQPGSIYFKYNQNKQLDLDVLIVDESSMISLPLFSKLLRAINENKIKHVILLGDKNQLSSVEEGYVFASLVNSMKLNYYVTRLLTSTRSNLDITNLATAVQVADIKTFDYLVQNSKNIKSYHARASNLFAKELFSKMDKSLTRYFKYIKQADLTDIGQLFTEFNRQIVLCLTNVGIFGTLYLNTQIEKMVKQIIVGLKRDIKPLTYDLFSTNEPQLLEQNCYGQWYTGRPIIIQENDYSLGLFNGDTGICIVTEAGAHVVFENGYKIIPEALPKFQIAYAITIHKAQGSEYEHVNLVLCDNLAIDNLSGLLSRELLYTALTRAKTSVNIFAGDKVLSYALNNIAPRNTGLDLLLGTE